VIPQVSVFHDFIRRRAPKIGLRLGPAIRRPGIIDSNRHYPQILIKKY